jgi:hypothetical protein
MVEGRTRTDKPKLVLSGRGGQSVLYIPTAQGWSTGEKKPDIRTEYRLAVQDSSSLREKKYKNF